MNNENFQLKVRLFGFPDVLMGRSAPTAADLMAKWLVSSSTLIGPRAIDVHQQQSNK